MKRAGGWWLIAVGSLLSLACGHAALPPVVRAPVPAPAPQPQFIMTPQDLAREGLKAFAAKDWKNAAGNLTMAAKDAPEIRPWLWLRIAEADRQLGEYSQAASLLAEIIATAPDTSAATTARLRLPAVYAQQNDAANTDATFRQALATPIDELTEGELVELASQLEKANRRDLAVSIRSNLLFDYPQGRYTERTYGQLASLPDSPIDRLSFDDALKLAQSLAKSDRYDQEFDLLTRIGNRFPDAAANPAYRNTKIRAQFNSRNYSQLLAETQSVKFDDPAMAVLRARAAWRAGHPDEFLAALDAVEKQWPTAAATIEAKTLRAKYYSSDVVDYAKAIDNLTAAINAGALGSDGENLWTLGFTQMLAGRTDDALRTFDDYIRRYPDGDYKTNSLFWAGKILDKRGDAAARNAKWSQLVSEYRYSYFAYRARELGGSALTPVAATNPFPNLDAEVAAAGDSRIAIVRALQGVGLHRDAAQEMQRIVAATPNDRGLQFLLADVYVEGGEPFKANNVLQRRFREFIRHGGTNIPQRFWEILFPLKYWDAYKAAAAKENVDPYLLAAITRQESGFEPTTVSNAGAVGLMQIMPAEAASIAQRANLGAVTREQLFDPATNISVGAAEFAQKLAAMHGNDILAIAAYNAGEDAVGKWLAQTPIDDVDLFVEAIPYGETRLYVKTVTRNRFEYRRIYEAGSNSSGSGSSQKP